MRVTCFDFIGDPMRVIWFRFFLGNLVDSLIFGGSSTLGTSWVLAHGM